MAWFDKRDGVARSTLWIWLCSVGTVAAQEDDIRGPKPLIEIPEPEPVTPWLSYALWGLLAQ